MQEQETALKSIGIEPESGKGSDLSCQEVFLETLNGDYFKMAEHM